MRPSVQLPPPGLGPLPPPAPYPQKGALLSLLVQGHGAPQVQAMETIAFLKHRRFDPELIDSMSAAYASVCHAVGLSTKSDQATETIAPKIIEIAARGARSPAAIHMLTMEILRETK